MSALAAIHVGLKQLGIQEDDARDIYERQTGKRSLRAMSPKEHDAVIGELRRMGFKPASKNARKPLEGRFARKLQALWISGYNLGVFRNKDDAALIAFVKRQSKVDHVRFLTEWRLAKPAIEGLKGILAREAGVEWPTSDDAREQQHAVIEAQMRILGETGPISATADLKALMADLGRRVRALRKAGG